MFNRKQRRILHLEDRLIDALSDAAWYEDCYRELLNELDKLVNLAGPMDRPSLKALVHDNMALVVS